MRPETAEERALSDALAAWVASAEACARAGVPGAVTLEIHQAPGKPRAWAVIAPDRTVLAVGEA